MSRRSTPINRFYISDPIYKSFLVHKSVNHIIIRGKKSLSYRIVYDVLYQIQNETHRNPFTILEHAVRMTTPVVQLKARRIGGTTYQVPVEVCSNRGTRIALFWILRSARKRPEPNIAQQLSAELLDAIRRIGNSIRKREEIHRIAEANKAFTRYRF